jgi:DNA-binding MarR family transcriptional regulator
MARAPRNKPAGRARNARQSPKNSTGSSPAHKFFIYKVGILRRALDRYSGPGLVKRSGLTVAEWRVLTHLYEAPATALELRMQGHADKAEISRACAGLVAKGYVRADIDPNDRRSAMLAITARGTKLHDAIVPLRQALQDELEAWLSPREIVEFHRILDKLTLHLSSRIRVPAKSGHEEPEASAPIRRR